MNIHELNYVLCIAKSNMTRKAGLFIAGILMQMAWCLQTYNSIQMDRLRREPKE